MLLSIGILYRYFYCDKFEGTYWTHLRNFFLEWNEELAEVFAIWGLDIVETMASCFQINADSLPAVAALDDNQKIFTSIQFADPALLDLADPQVEVAGLGVAGVLIGVLQPYFVVAR